MLALTTAARWALSPDQPGAGCRDRDQAGTWFPAGTRPAAAAAWQARCRRCVLAITWGPPCCRGLRQKLHSLAVHQDWAAQHGVHIASRSEPHNMSYTQLLSSSTFCLVLPGAAQAPLLCAC